MILYKNMTDLDREINDAGAWHEYHSKNGNHELAEFYRELRLKLQDSKQNNDNDIVPSGLNIKESTEEDYLIEGMKAEVTRFFPNGWVAAGPSRLGGMFIRFGIVKKGDIPGSIAQNDPAFHIFSITDLDDDKYRLEKIGGSISVNPREKYMALSSVKTPFRKTTGDATKIVKTFAIFLANTRKLVDENKSDIYHVENYPYL